MVLVTMKLKWIHRGERHFSPSNANEKRSAYLHQRAGFGLSTGGTGSILLTETPKVIGYFGSPRVFLGDGDDIRISIGTLLRYSISLKDLLSLNRGLWENCTNLWANSSYCVAPVGDTTPTRTFTITPQSATPVPWADPFGPSNRSDAAIIIPTANNSPTDCWDYLWWNATLSPPLGCWDITPWYGITREEFVLWNPSLAKNGTETITVSDDAADANTPSTTTTITGYNYPCTIEPNLSYCVALASPTPQAQETAGPPAPRASGEIASCTAWFAGVLDCASHISLLRLDLKTFYGYNPSVKADCSGYVLGTYYCYATDSNTGSDDEEDDEGTHTVTPTGTTSTTPSSTTTTGIQTPTPTQDEMISTCTTFYKVQSDDGCWAIANDHGIALDDFYAWNLAVKSDCSGLLPTYYVCVGVDQPPASPTSSSATAESTSTSTRTSTGTSTGTAMLASTDGTCGAAVGMTCSGSTFGTCYSGTNYCGSSAAYCGSECQKAYGDCDANAKTISPDGTCGMGSNGNGKGYTCAGSAFGECCSASDYCGLTAEYCGAGCQGSFGECT
ncbi:hypothetical protein BDV06DRAFT_223901 [Aspergillus oleicola]